MMVPIYYVPPAGRRPQGPSGHQQWCPSWKNAGGTTDGVCTCQGVMTKSEHKPTDTERLDWWDRHKMDGPQYGLCSDGVLGHERGAHVVSTEWVVRGRVYHSLREAIDAAMEAK